MEFSSKIILIIIISLYFIPTLIALLRVKSNTVAILLLNVFLGWTFVGWVVSLVWAVTKDKQPPVLDSNISQTIQDNNKNVLFKNKSYILISYIILVFGILVVPEIIDRIQNNEIVKGDRLDKINNSGAENESLVKIGPAPKFELTNQDNLKISNENYKGKVYVLEFFFTSCPSICPKMNLSMLEIEKTFFGNPNFGIVSISIDPSHDTPEVLKKHAKLLGAKSSNWNFLTGDKTYIYDLSNKGFNLYAGENSKVNGGFEHSGLFALIDKNGNIRCRKDDFGNPILYYDGLDKKGVRDIQQDIAILLKE